MARKKIVAGNWKMNMTPSQAVARVEELKPLVASDEVEVVYCVPAIDIVPVVEAVKGTNVAVGAENMYYEEKGAYTGEIAPEMLKQAWQQAAGSFLATQAELVSLVNGQAVICTSHPAVRYELLQHRQEIIRALNATLGEGCVQTVRLMHG